MNEDNSLQNRNYGEENIPNNEEKPQQYNNISE